MNKMIALSLLAGAAVSTSALAAEPVSRDEVRSMVAEMLADAETRSSLLQGGGIAGYEKGFVVRSPSGDFSLKVNGLIQFRYIANFRDKDNVTAPSNGQEIPQGAFGPNNPPTDITLTPNSRVGADEFTHGFQLRKSYLVFSGNIVNSDLKYNIRIGQQINDSVNVDDVFFEYNYGSGLSVRAGQFKPNFLKEESNNDPFTLGVERGVVNSVFSQGRAQGVSFQFTPADELDFFFDITNGFRSKGNDFTDPDNAEYALTGRGNWRFAGSAADLVDYTSKVGSAFAGQAGLALHWQQGTESAGQFPGGTNAFPRQDLFAYTADVQVEGGGLGGYAAVVGTNINSNGGANLVDGNALGFTAQGSWRWDAAPEVFVKYDGLYLGGLNGNNQLGADFTENQHFVTFGFANYYADSAAKFTVDCIVSLSRNDGLASATIGGANPLGSNLGLIGSTNKAGEFAVRAQFQVGF
jgi:hypothetical protein